MDEREGRLYWQCRRGMRELDAMLVAFLKQAYDDMDDGKRKEFEMLLSVNDTDLLQILMQHRAPPEGVSGELIQSIRGNARTGADTII